MDKKAEANKAVVWLVVIVAIGAFLFYAYGQKTSSDHPLMSVLMYDEQGNPITPPASSNPFNMGTFSAVTIAGQTTNHVGSIAFLISPCSNDTEPLTFRVGSLTSTVSNALTSATKPTTSVVVAQGACAQFISNQINMSTFEGNTVNFCVNITSDASATRNPGSKTACTSIIVAKDTTSGSTLSNASYTVTIVGNSGGGGNICVPNWVCGAWSSCIFQTHSHLCNDVNACVPPVTKTESEACNQVSFKSYGCGGSMAGYVYPGCIISVDTNGIGNLMNYTYYANNMGDSSNMNGYGFIITQNSTEGFRLVYDPTLPGVNNHGGVRMFSKVPSESQNVFTAMN